jgi:catechol 2,3-dioxygenase-like lactoylglutathione lyase family enzyme
MLMTMQLSGFSHVALTVSDMKVSREFYSRTLGLTVLDSSESYCAFLVGATGATTVLLATCAGANGDITSTSAIRTTSRWNS